MHGFGASKLLYIVSYRTILDHYLTENLLNKSEKKGLQKKPLRLIMSANDDNNNSSGSSGAADNTSDDTSLRAAVETGKEYADKAKEQYAGLAAQISAMRASLKSGIKVAVDATNDALASAEETTISVRKPIAEGVKTVEHEGSKAISEVWKAYEHRHEYGPHIVGGSALLVGGLVGMRRGRIPAAVSAALIGGLAYTFVYEPFPLQDIPDMLKGSSSKDD